MLLRHPEQFSHELRAIPKVFLDEFRADDTQERGRGLVRHRLCQKRLASTGHTVQDDTLGRLDTHLLVQLWMCQRKLYRFLKAIELHSTK